MDLSKDSVSNKTGPHAVINEKISTLRKNIEKLKGMNITSVVNKKQKSTRRKIDCEVKDPFDSSIILTNKSQKFREELLTKIYFPKPMFPPSSFLTRTSSPIRKVMLPRTVRNLTPLKTSVLKRDFWAKAEKLYRGHDGNWLGKIAGIKK